jgi:hypothetical protein
VVAVALLKMIVEGLWGAYRPDTLIDRPYKPNLVLGTTFDAIAGHAVACAQTTERSSGKTCWTLCSPPRGKYMA